MNNDQVEPLVKKMLADSERIRSIETSSDFEEDGQEFYFVYPEDKNYLWSVAKDKAGECYLFFYPNKTDKSNFLRFIGAELSESTNLALGKLFALVERKRFGFDQVVKDILGQ